MALTPKNRMARKILGSAIVTAELLNIRTQPAETASIVTIAKKGTAFNVTEGGNKTFTAIIVNDEICYAMTKYLEVTVS